MFEFGLGPQVEDLENVTGWVIRCFQTNNVLRNVHDGSINLAAWSLDDVHVICQFDDADLEAALSILVPHTHILLRFESSNSELEE